MLVGMQGRRQASFLDSPGRPQDLGLVPDVPADKLNEALSAYVATAGARAFCLGVYADKQKTTHADVPALVANKDLLVQLVPLFPDGRVKDTQLRHALGLLIKQHPHLHGWGQPAVPALWVDWASLQIRCMLAHVKRVGVSAVKWREAVNKCDPDDLAELAEILKLAPWFQEEQPRSAVLSSPGSTSSLASSSSSRKLAVRLSTDSDGVPNVFKRAEATETGSDATVMQSKKPKRVGQPLDHALDFPISIKFGSAALDAEDPPEAEHQAQASAGKPIAATRGGQKKDVLMKRPAAKEKAFKKPANNDGKTVYCSQHNRIRITCGSQQTYITAFGEDGKWTLLVSCSAKQSSDHQLIVQTLFDFASKNDVDKDCLVKLRNQWLSDGKCPLEDECEAGQDDEPE